MRQKWGAERAWMSIERWRMKQRWAMERGQMGIERWRMRHRFGSHVMVRKTDERRRLNRR